MKVAEKEGEEEGCGGRREPNGSIGGDSTLASRDGARRTDAARVSTGSGGFTELSRAIGKFNFLLVSFLFHKPFVCRRRRRRESSDDDAAATEATCARWSETRMFSRVVVA